MILAAILPTARIACFKIVATIAGCGGNMRLRRIALRSELDCRRHSPVMGAMAR
jgi:hypothetical protein